jgi:hypothetical protein
MSDKVLTFELNQNSDEIDIHGNEQGFLELIETINRVISSSQHDHLMTPNWGGSELSNEKQGETSRLINKVTIHIWK